MYNTISMPNGAGYMDYEDVDPVEIVDIHDLTNDQYSRLENAYYEEGLAVTDDPEEVEKFILFLSQKEAERLLAIY